MRRRGKPAVGHGARHWRSRRVTVPLALIAAVFAVGWPAPSAAPDAATPSTVVSAGSPAVGALFTVSDGQLGAHFCTASVVDSPAGDLLITAAHCVAGYSDTNPADLAFVPGYNGTAPFGTWTVTRIFVDQAWASTADPADDVAFLAVAQPRTGTPIQNVAGGERLDIGRPATGVVRVIGYPDTQNQPLSCLNRIVAVSYTQMQFDCDGYADGTSGSPFLTGVGADAGEPAVIGVIGGYQQGGDSANVSYAAAFGQNVQALYEVAVSRR